MSCVMAERLPLLKTKNWTSYHAVSKGIHHAVGIGVDGSVDLYFLKRGKKDNISWPVEMRVRIERKAKPAKGKITKWVNKKVRKDSFVLPPKASDDIEELTLIGEVTGGTKFQLDFKFTKAGVLLSGKILDEPTDADYRIILESDIEKLSTISTADSKDVKKVKSKTRGDELNISTRNEKELRVKFYEVVDVKLLEKAQVTAVELKAKKIGRKKLSWSLANKKMGQLNIECKADNGMPYAGFTITTMLYDESGKQLGEGILLEYK